MIRAVLIIALFWLPIPALAQGFGALARVLPEESSLSGSGHAADLQLALSQAVPFRVFTLTDPMRVVMDFREVAFDSLPEDFNTARSIEAVAYGGASTPGWSRMVLTLGTPMLPEIAAMETDDETGEALVTLSLQSVSADVFADRAGPPPGLGVSLQPLVSQVQTSVEADTVLVVLDPGHGGVDPGAVRDGFTEADLMLTFSRELREIMRRTGDIEVIVTRDADLFVPLPTRVTIARAAGADLFISLHADALAEGRAQGATVYTLAAEASDVATAALAEQHDRADLLHGIDLAGTDDEVVSVLMDLARLENAPRSSAFADTLVSAIDATGLDLHARPRGEGAFSVLKAADFPAVLLEVGFLSDGGDLENILDPAWRGRMQNAITDAVLAWAEIDAATRALSRQ